MIVKPRWVIVALSIPLFALAILAAKEHYAFANGKEIILPIEGYDPRDLLTGHYLTYRINYGVKEICNPLSYMRTDVPIFYCADVKSFSYNKPFLCHGVIKGYCRYGKFTAGIEKFYIPEAYATKLNQLIMAKRAKIVIVVNKNGVAKVKRLLIDDKPWFNSVDSRK